MNTTKTLSVAFLVGLVHIMVGLSIMRQPAALLATPFATLNWISQLYHVAPIWIGSTMVLVGAAAVYGVFGGSGTGWAWRLALFTPQQVLLVFQLLSISIALHTGSYPDGYAPQGGGWFILSDQAQAFVLAASHTAWLTAFIYSGVERGRYS